MVGKNSIDHKHDAKFRYSIGDIVVDKLRNTFNGGGHYLICGLDAEIRKYEVILIGTSNKYTYTIESLEYFFTKEA